METDGKHHARRYAPLDARADVPPQRLPPGTPPHPFLRWLREQRPPAAPGVWRYGHRPKPPLDPDRLTDRQLLGGALLALLSGWLVWSLCWNGYISIWLWPLDWFTPGSWKGTHAYVVASYTYYGVFIAVLVLLFGRLGHWDEVWRRYVVPVLQRPGPHHRPLAEPEEPADPADFPGLRAAGLPEAADRLAAEARSGAMLDVDHSRLGRAWESVKAQPARLRAFAEAVARDGAAACPHPSGVRDLDSRAARHDLRTGQVRIGAAPEDERNGYVYRGEGIALYPEVLSTGLLVVGPAASGKTSRVVGPVVEALCLQALAGRAAVVAVGAPGARLGPDTAFDVVVRIGDPDSRHDLDLYGGTPDPDEAAALLTEALLGGEEDASPQGPARSRQGSTALAQLLGAFRAGHGRFPGVAELRALLDGDAVALGTLRDACEAAGGGAGDGAALRELDARERQAARSGDVGPLLADRLAVLDRPAFTGFFHPGAGKAVRRGQFSMRALEHPMRVRISLPERGHGEAARILARLLLAQFNAAVPARADSSLFAALVLDDAAQTATPESVRGVQRLRTAHAGVVLGLRSLDEVPERLRGPLLAAVGCRMALSGVSTWDGRLFAEAWGAEWVEARDITHSPDVSGGVLRRALRGLRQMFTGTKAMSRSVTVRQVERERWSASDLANRLPAGHAVLSVTTAVGERTAPVLVDLHG